MAKQTAWDRVAAATAPTDVDVAEFSSWISLNWVTSAPPPLSCGDLSDTVSRVYIQEFCGTWIKVEKQTFGLRWLAKPWKPKNSLI